MTVNKAPSSVVIALAASAAALFFLAAAGPALAAANCSQQNDPISPSIVCTSGNYWCGGTCQSQPACPGGTGDPYNVKTERNCTVCACACPTDKPNDCTGTSARTCQATNPACDPAHRVSVCNTVSGETTQICGACVSGYYDCTGNCEPTTDPSCPAPGYWDPCLKKCIEKYILSNPTVPQSPQIINAKVQGDMSMVDGNLSITSATLGKGDIYLSSTKAIRVDGSGQTALNLGNWFAGLPAAAGVRLNLFGELCLSNGTVCRSIWPTGLPDGTAAGQTVRYNGSAWVTSNLLINDASNIGIGTMTPAKNLDIRGTAGGVIARLNDDIGGGSRLWTGFNLARSAVEKWFVGMDNATDKLLFRRTESSNDMVIDTTGNVGIGTASPFRLFQVGGTTGNNLIRVSGSTSSIEFVSGSNYANIGFDSSIIGGASSDLTLNAATGANLRLYTNGAERVRVGADGNVGLGTTVPAKNLDIRGTAGGVIARLNDDIGGGSRLWTGFNLARSAVEKWFVGMGTSNDNLLFRRTESSNDVIIDTSGNVGIGVSPAYPFHVSRGAAGVFAASIENTDATGHGLEVRTSQTTSGDILGLYSASANRFVVMSSGNVGIGTGNPAQPLDVNGMAQVGSFKMPAGAANNYVMTTDAAGVGTWRQILFADACTGGKFDHLTSTGGSLSDGTYDGNDLGSYQAVNAACGANQHICTPDEILRSVYCTSAMPLPPSAFETRTMAWVANGPPGFTSPAANDCAGFTSGSATAYGAFWQFAGTAGGSAYATSCTVKLPVACCKQ